MSSSQLAITLTLCRCIQISPLSIYFLRSYIACLRTVVRSFDLYRKFHFSSFLPCPLFPPSGNPLTIHKGQSKERTGDYFYFSLFSSSSFSRRPHIQEKKKIVVVVSSSLLFPGLQSLIKASPPPCPEERNRFQASIQEGSFTRLPLLPEG